MKALILLLAVAGCAAIDPMTRSGTWSPTGANDINLQAMVANPQDLVSGTSAPVTDATIAAAAVNRYRIGKVKPLPDSGLAKIAPVAFGVAPVQAAGPE